jgi:hypothetical protein
MIFGSSILILPVSVVIFPTLVSRPDLLQFRDSELEVNVSTNFVLVIPSHGF